jgi:hypothetical protein
MRTLAAWVCLLTMSVVIAAGCTARQSREQYEERLASATDVRIQITKALTSNQFTTQEQYTEAAASVADALAALDADAPPQAVAAGHERMVEALEALEILLTRRGRCAALERVSAQDARACRMSIEQSVYDEIRNNFGEADTIYREEGYSLTGIPDGDGGTSDGGDEL